MVLVAAFTIRLLRRTFFSDEIAAQTGAESAVNYAPITFAEKVGAVLLLLTTLAAGVYPKFLLDRIMPAVETMRFLNNPAGG